MWTTGRPNHPIRHDSNICSAPHPEASDPEGRRLGSAGDADQQAAVDAPGADLAAGGDQVAVELAGASEPARTTTSVPVIRVISSSVRLSFDSTRIASGIQDRKRRG